MAKVGVALVVLAGGMALGVMWGTRVRLEAYGYVDPVTLLIFKGRPIISLLVLVGCSLGIFVRSARQSALALGAIGVTLLLITIVYAGLVWLPYGYSPHPVG